MFLHYVSPLICHKHQTVGSSQLIALIYDGAEGYLRLIFRVWIRALNQSSCGRDPTHSDDRSVHPAFPRIRPATREPDTSSLILNSVHLTCRPGPSQTAVATVNTTAKISYHAMRKNNRPNSHRSAGEEICVDREDLV